MAEIDLVNLTNSTDNTDGNGVFDVLIQAVERHIEGQYETGRITGQDYSTVYLGSMQSVLAESVKFLLSEQQADKQADLIAEQIVEQQKKTEPGGLIDLEKQKLQEQIDLIIAQTASQYEGIQASSQDTVRKNLINSKQAIKLDKDTEYVVSQNTELLATGPVERALKEAQTTATTTGALDNTNKVNADVALTNAQELKVISTTENEDQESTEKVLLLQSQTTGFKSDAKQKLMKQLAELYAINVTTEGALSVLPNGSAGPALDDIANDILDDWASTVNIP